MNRKPKSLTRNSKFCGSEICPIDPAHPDPSVLDKAAAVVKSGGIVIFPTRTLYGIGVDAFNKEAVARVFRIKQRAAQNPLSVLIRSTDAVATLAAKIPLAAVKLMAAFWPGRLTIVFSARPNVLSSLTAGTGKIGIRVPEHPVAVGLVESLNCPLTGTSANLSGQPGADSVDQLPEELIRNVDLVIDAGKLKGGIGSTVVDVSVNPPVILREGEVSRNELFRAV